MTAAPSRTIAFFWQLLWSPLGVIVAIGIWWWYGFPLPDWEAWNPILIEFAASYWLYGLLLLPVWPVWRGIRRLARWWRDRPRERVVEKIVYRDRPVEQLQQDQPKRSVAEVITAEYQDNITLINSLPLDEPERRAAKHRAKIIMVKKLERYLK